jgi:chemotaxis signal transduction protein
MDWDIAKQRPERIQERIEHSGIATAEHRRRVLHARARILSAPERHWQSFEEVPGSILVFRSGSHRHAIQLSDVVEILRDVRLAIVPGAPPHVTGLIQVRGEVRPVYRFENLLRDESESVVEPGIILLIRSAGREFAIFAGAAEDVRHVPASSRRSAPADARHIRWMTEDHIAVIDPASLLGGTQ